MLTWDGDLRLAGTPLFLDSRHPRDICFVSHAHGDHIAPHKRVICTSGTALLGHHRCGWEGAQCSPYGTTVALDEATQLTLTPAGHVLGSAMLHAQRGDESLLYTGDFKLRPSLTCEAAEPMRADVLVMETTYGRPEYRFPPASLVAEQMCELVGGALRAGRQPIVLGYSLGKAQEITRILTNAGFAVTQHGAAHSITQLYHQLGMQTGEVRRYRFEDFHGPDALDLRQRGVLVAPPHVARTAFVTRFENPLRIVMTGWALDPSAKYRYGVEHALPFSDHADFEELLELIERVNPKRVLTLHGFTEFVDHLRARGISAELAKPREQLELF